MTATTDRFLQDDDVEWVDDLDGHPSVFKCLTCGCDMPHNEHDDHRHITWEDLEAAADAAGITTEQAYHNLVHTAPHEWTGDETPKPNLVKVGPKGYVHGWIFVGAPGAGKLKPHGQEHTLLDEKDYPSTTDLQWTLKPKALKDAKLTGQERAAMDAYKSSKYHTINGALRDPADFATLPEDAQQSVKQTIDNLDSAISKSHFDVPVQAFRGLNNEKGVIPDDVSGVQIHDKAFVSTSWSRAAAMDFAKSMKPVLLQVSIPAGHPALPVGNNEGELLLPRDSTLHLIDELEPLPNGTRVVRAVVI